MARKKLTGGFSLIEILIVMALVGLVGGFALFVSMETFRGSSFHADRDLLIAALQRARAESMNNTCLGSCSDGLAHGVHIQSDKYVVFQGNTYNAADPLNQSYESSPATTKTGATDILFAQLSGASAGGTITLTGSSRTSVVTVGTEGQISWTN